MLGYHRRIRSAYSSVSFYGNRCHLGFSIPTGNSTIEAPVISSSDFTSGVYFLGLTFDYKIDRRKGTKKKREKKKMKKERKKERLDYKLNGWRKIYSEIFVKLLKSIYKPTSFNDDWGNQKRGDSGIILEHLAREDIVDRLLADRQTFGQFLRTRSTSLYLKRTNSH